VLIRIGLVTLNNVRDGWPHLMACNSPVDLRKKFLNVFMGGRIIVDKDTILGDICGTLILDEHFSMLWLVTNELDQKELVCLLGLGLLLLTMLEMVGPI
jgi:hypothetical protein